MENISTKFQIRGDKERTHETYKWYDECVSDAGNEVAGSFRDILWEKE